MGYAYCMAQLTKRQRYLKRYAKRYYRTNRKRLLAQCRQYKATPAGKATQRRYNAGPARKEYDHRYNASARGKDLHKANFHKRRAPGEGYFTRKEWLALKVQYGNRCLGCGKTEKQLKRLGRVLSADHVIALLHKGPELRGHRNEISNIQPLCHGPHGCNNKKACTVADYRVLVTFSNTPKAVRR